MYPMGYIFGTIIIMRSRDENLHEATTEKIQNASGLLYKDRH